jgi:diguanylate cyclase (GGDEF)-like protein
MKVEKSKKVPREHDELMTFKSPQALADELMAGKNLWLTKIRWVYTLFILLFFLAYNSFAEEVAIAPRTLGLILGLSALGNIIFILALRRSLRFPSEKNDYTLYTTMASLQLDFDLVVLSLLVFFSDGFASPVMMMFIFYIMVATFLIHHRKAIKNTVTAMVLVVVIFFSSEGAEFSSQKLTTMAAFIVILLFTYIISAYLAKNLGENEIKIRDLLKKSQELSVTDGLTNLYNQAYFLLLLRLQVQKSLRYKTPFSIIMFDVDHFKSYNDHMGHPKGSEVLQRIGELMRRVFRNSDVMAKYGGDEFVILLTDTDKVGAFLAADRLRELVEEEPIEGEDLQPLGKLTLSLGVASFPEHGDDLEKLLDRADKALYYAKKYGRNKAAIYNQDMDQE